MDWLFDTPIRQVTLSAAAAGLVASGWRGIRAFRRGLGAAADPDGTAHVIRGFRALIVAAGLGFLIGGVATSTTWPIAFAAVFLAEELLETGIMLLALRRGRVAVVRPDPGEGRSR